MIDVQEKRRARTFEEFGEKMGAMFGGMAAKQDPYRPRAADVIITPFGKCGTTWLQQIFHTLRTRGDCDYDDISRVVPWIETSPGLGLDINGEQKANPRGFKSHLAWDQLPRGAKYLVSMRDPRDALVSMYKFMEGWFIEPGAIPIDDFAKRQFIDTPPDGGYFHHLISYWKHREDDDVLLLSYEGMKDDHEGTVKRVANFCGIPLDDELLAITLENSSLDFMLKHKDKFDDKLMRDMSEKLANVPSGSDSAKVREGKVGGHTNILSKATLDAMQAKWDEQITPKFGFASYAEMESALRKEL